MVQMEAETSRIVYIERAGTMSQVISADELRQLSDLKVTGNFNSSDVYFINNALSTSSTLISIDMGEANYDSNSWSVNLRLSNLSSIVLPKGITSIGSSAFADCSSLTSITIPNSVIDIGEKAFYKCKTLLNITIPNAITTIGASAFYGCNSLENVVLPNGVTTIGSYAFAGCDNLSLIELPENLTTIRDGAFYDCKKLVSIVFPQGLTSIADRTCNGCFSLVNVEIPEGVTNIGKDAFNGCRSLSSITIPSSVTSIGGAAFEYCSSLSSARFASVESMCNISYGDNGAKPTFVAHHIYIGNSSEEIKELVIPSSVSSIEDYLFRQCSSIESVYVSEGVTQIGKYAFAQCSNLSEVFFKEGLESIGQSAFEYCDKLTSLEIFEGVKSIGENAFNGCENLFFISIPGSTISIGGNAFNRCDNLQGVRFASVESMCLIEYGGVRAKPTFYTHNIYIGNSEEKIKNVVIPPTVSSIPDDLFKSCESIEELTIPTSVVKIGNTAFSGCKNLRKARFGSIESLCNIDFGSGSIPFTQGLQLYIGDSEEEIREIIIPSTVKKITDYLFSQCKTLERVTMSEGITSIGAGSFQGCENLVSVIIPEGIESIGSSSFLDCYRLANVTIPNSVSFIGDKAFYNVELLEFVSTTVPQYINENIFNEGTIIVAPTEAYEDYCTFPALQNQALLGRIAPGRSQLFQSIEVQAMNNGSGILNAMGIEGMTHVYNLTLRGTINGYDIMVLRNKMPKLRHLDMTDVDIVANPYEYCQGCHTEDNRLGPNTFSGQTYLFGIKLPKSIKSIGESAFQGCSNLKEAIIESNVSDIGNSSFKDCSALYEITIPCSVVSIGNAAFNGCHRIKTISFHEGLRVIGQEAFRNCYDLKNVILPSTIERISNGAFSYCIGIDELVLPDNIREIGQSAFAGCKQLKSIHIPPMVEAIGNSAFEGANSLNDIFVYMANPNDITISQNTFSTWQTATLHVPSFGYGEYYLHTQWGKFLHLEKFDEEYKSFYTKNTMILDHNTGVIEGSPDALLYQQGSLIVNENEKQLLGEVTLTNDGNEGSSLIAECTGNIIAESISLNINVQAEKWHFFCFPFDVDLSNVVYDGDYIWRQYDGAKRSRREGGWQNLPNGTTSLQAGRGYIFRGTTSGVLHLEVSHPTLIGDDVCEELNTYESADTDPADANWNFVGNPYTSYYVVDEDTYNAPITVWTGNGYEAYRPGDDDYEFAPYEAFFVQTSATTNIMNFSADNREGYEGVQATQSQRRVARAQKKVNPNRLLVNLHLGVQGEEDYHDKTRVVFNDECSSDYESDCDAAKFFSDERRAELYTIGSDGTQYAINERPEDGGYVDLGFVANQKGRYSISAQRMDVPMLLVDDVMDTTFDLRNGAYEFSSAKGTFNKRFHLKRYEGITTSIKDLADQIGMTFSISDGTISIEGLNDATRVCLYNTVGQQMATRQGNGTLTAIPGACIISVGKLSAKVQIK